jgi:hypothetical protein
MVDHSAHAMPRPGAGNERGLRISAWLTGIYFTSMPGRSPPARTCSRPISVSIKRAMLQLCFAMGMTCCAKGTGSTSRRSKCLDEDHARDLDISTLLFPALARR